MNINKLQLRRKFILFISFLFLVLSVYIETKELFVKQEYRISYEYINVKDMATSNVVVKEDDRNIFTKLLEIVTTNQSSPSGLVEADSSNIESVELPQINDSQSNPVTPKTIWHLPTEMGRITTFPNYGHVALDITSPRTYQETIFPVANGVVTGIYTDPAGALTVTVLHNVGGQRYSSQYVHLSRYAEGLYIGKEVTINDALGQMGSTGYSTGPHLHLAVVDCGMFQSGDACQDLNGFFNYGRVRFNQGFYGLQTVMYVPTAWDNR